MDGFPILSAMLLVPLVAGIACFFLEAQAARLTALAATLANLALGVMLWISYDIGGAQWQFVEKAPLFAGFSYALGIDGIALMLIMLSVFLMPICILASWEAITKRVGEYMAAFLIMEVLMIGVFAAQDLFLFYIFFEAGLIPMYLIIGVWGGDNRIYASYKFFLYTLLGSVLMLIAMFWMVSTAGTSDIPTLMQYDFAPEVQTWLWLAFFASFAVKMPMWPVHTWLPDAHVQAPTAGSVILAAILLKMGGYGFLRFSIPMLPDASALFSPLIFTLSVVAVVYTSLVALAQEDMKKLIAYSSVAHMGFVTAGTFTLTQQGVEGALYQMLSHGIVSAALFLCVGVVYDRLHSREIARYGGLVHRMPRYAFVFMVFMLASVGMPGTSGFIGEFLVMVGAFQVSTWLALLLATGLILGAAYMLWLYRRVIFGKLTKPDLMSILDLSRREVLVFAPLVIMVFWMGVYPASFLEIIGPSVENLIRNYETALAASGTSPEVARGFDLTGLWQAT
ncbi:MAG TPA: NADH-quinone oxidoreductase subunit M, partial [Erythrobacter sp.]|nr:NADH-quinone oxidoreductase subunit M [Erythrobacter sp.]